MKDHYPIQIYDPQPRLARKNSDEAGLVVRRQRRQVLPTKYAVICVPTRPQKDGSCDTSLVEETVVKSKHQYYLIKSTVAPGTTRKLVERTGKKIAFSPEYLGEGKYEIPFWKDLPHPTNMKLHQFHIFGGERQTMRAWVEVWQKIAGWGPVYVQTDSTTAELVKYMENAFLATKKIFCDEFYDIAKALGVDYNELRELCLLDGRIGRSHTLIYPDKRGFGGKCLPKDTAALVKAAEKAGYSPELIKSVLAINQEMIKKSKN